MKNIEDQIIAYLEGGLSVEDQAILEAQIQSDEKLKQLVEDYKLMYAHMDQDEEELPSSAMDQKFYNFLQKEEQAHRTVAAKPEAKVFALGNLMKYAAVAMVLVASALVIKNNLAPRESDEVRMAFNDQNSDTERIKAIYVSSDNNMTETKGDAAEQKIISVLIQSLKEDPSSHVRLASVETLGEYMDHADVRSAMIRALGVEKDPQVQISLIMALSNAKEKDALAPLEELTTKEDIYNFIKEEAHAGIMRINSI